MCLPPGPGISPSAKGPKWAKTPLNRYFQPVGVRPKKVRKTSVVTFFSPFRDPEHREIVFLCFPPRPGISLSATGPKWAKTPLNCHFWPVGVRPKKNLSQETCEKSSWIAWKFFFPIKVPWEVALGNCVFVFPARAWNFFKCQGPKMDQNPTKLLFPAGGVPTKK